MKNRALISFLLIICSILFAGFFSEANAQENINILSTTIYQTYGNAPFSVSKGDYIVAGEVENFGSETQKFNVTATFYDAAGSILGTAFLSDSLTDSSPCYLHVLLPTQKSPFAVWFSRFDEQGNFRLVDHYDLVLTPSLAGTYQPSLEILSKSSNEAGSTLYVEGNIENTGSIRIDNLNVYVTYYKQNGDVLAVSTEGGSGLAPKETVPYSVSLNGFNEGGRLEEIYRYEVTAEGYKNSLWTSDGQLISPEVVYVLGTPEATFVPVQPESFPYLIYIIAIVLVIVIIIAAFLVKSSKKKDRTNRLQKQSPQI